jgi:hypothetical protein
MIRMGRALWGVFFVTHVLMAGEVSYQETTKITGGSITSMMKFAGAFSKDARKAGQPMVTTIAVKGNRMARATQDYADITDLDARTVTHVDKIKHEYSVMTFAQMKEALQHSIEKAKAEGNKAPSQSGPTSSTTKDPNVQLNFEVHVRKTGATKQLSGIDTNETILTVNLNGTDKSSGQQGAMAVTNDMWMAPEPPGFVEVHDFERKLAIEMGSAFQTTPDVSGMVQQAQSSDALKAMAKEMSQLQGVPVLQVMRMGMTANGQALPAASEAPLPGNNSNGPSLGDAVGAQVIKTSEETAQRTAAQETAQRVGGALGSNLGSAIGGFGGFGRKKKQSATQETAASSTPSSQSSAKPAESAVLLESTTELSNLTQHVDPSIMEVPSGFKLVTTPELKRN